jgi:hypothetical protein
MSGAKREFVVLLFPSTPDPRPSCPSARDIRPSLLGGQAKGGIDKAPNSPKMVGMEIIPRIMESRIRQALQRQKSVLLLGPRQTGKTTLLKPLQPDLLLAPRTRKDSPSRRQGC